MSNPWDEPANHPSPDNREFSLDLPPSVLPPGSQNSTKEKRPPSITPRKFSRFFTPRSHGNDPGSSSRRVLFDVTIPANNRNGILSSPIRACNSMNSGEDSPTSFPRDLKRRKLFHSSCSPQKSPDHFEELQINQPCCTLAGEFSEDNASQSTQSPEYEVANPFHSMKSLDSKYDGDLQDQSPAGFSGAPSAPIKHIGSRGLAGALLRMRIDSTSHSSYSSVDSMMPDWQNDTASFYSGATDTHFCTSTDGSERCIPFCVASCNTASLVAIGDEEGRVRLLESARNSKPDFKDAYLSFRPHSNAVIDMSFSLDDSLLATASGDQTARVVDMATQTTISILAQHSASLKQVKWQPGAANNSVIATSSRDGSIQIWDLRCRGSEGPTHNIHVPLDPTVQSSARSSTVVTSYASAINKIQNAHRPILQSRTSRNDIARDGPSRNDVERVGDVSVTSISFLPQGQEHLLLSASEANATVKLWDIRSLQSSRRKASSPLSSTQQPQSHSQWRHFGISSINLSSDGSRLYTLCKDNSVYAYSMAHLILGRAPELSIPNATRRGPVGESREGLGPLYAFRHPQLHVTSFYVKSSTRPPKNGQAEILAVGSSDGCTVLFPTDERHHWQQRTSTSSDLESTTANGRRRLPGLAAEVHAGTCPKDDNIPIIQSGTPLIRGHDREVGALTWTSEGALVTVGDDFIVRCWREGDRARDLRTGGEEGGRRWGCGWAAMSDSYDEDFE